MEQGVTEVTSYFPSASRWYDFHTVGLNNNLKINLVGVMLVLPVIVAFNVSQE